tara:strand:+ start:316 stop:498 length:183 start_codon:yes stop_codon:yes gene_type:complete
MSTRLEVWLAVAIVFTITLIGALILDFIGDQFGAFYLWVTVLGGLYLLVKTAQRHEKRHR